MLTAVGGSARASQLVKAGVKAKAVKRGVKEVVKGVRKGAKGVCVIAGNISPLDVISHLPVLCEDAGVPYCYVRRTVQELSFGWKNF